jgi:hypothetical protein
MPIPTNPANRMDRPTSFPTRTESETGSTKRLADSTSISRIDISFSSGQETTFVSGVVETGSVSRCTTIPLRELSAAAQLWGLTFDDVYTSLVSDVAEFQQYIREQLMLHVRTQSGQTFPQSVVDDLFESGISRFPHLFEQIPQTSSSRVSVVRIQLT